MPLPAQFQLGLELTNIVNPLSQAVSALGSLALVDAIKKAGSDAITEMKLASLIGRHRIDEVIKWHFREKVAKADRSIISRYMDIVLESGSGPTVQEALKNPALFSMIIQLSALAFAHEDESLANGIVEAIERIVKESCAEVEMVPDYVSLLGTLRAVQQQTAQFQWASLYEAVELKIESAIKASPGVDRNRNSNRRKVKPNATNEIPLSFGNHPSVTMRNLPFPVLQSLIMWLQSLQAFPEHRLLHLRCDSGISTVVVWCRHLLGLTVKVTVQGVEICFGNEPANVLIEEIYSQSIGATLMDPANPNEPLFNLANDGNQPELSHESRAEAFGFGMRILQDARLPRDLIEYCIHWVIARCLLPSPTDSGAIYFSDVARPQLFQRPYPSSDRILHAGRVLFALENLNIELVESHKNTILKKTQMVNKVNLPALAAVLLAFARIDEGDLGKCMNMPLSIFTYHRLRSTELSVEGYFSGNGKTKYMDLIASFRLLSHLLLGPVYSADYFATAVLVSAWGWSVFLDAVDAMDPTDVSTNSMRVMCGVPSRRGVRRTRIIDGPNDLRLPLSFTTGETLSNDPQILYFPGVSTTKKGPTLVGHHSDAFQVTQTFNWASMGKHEKTHKLGFREMQEMCIKADILPQCTHEDDIESFEAWLDKRTYFTDLRGTNTRTGGANTLGEKKGRVGIPYFEVRWPSGERSRIDSSIRSERVFTGQSPMSLDDKETPIFFDGAFNYKSNNVWSFYVTNNAAARWLQLQDLCNPDLERRFPLVMRGSGTCLKCASNNHDLKKFENALVLL